VQADQPPTFSRLCKDGAVLLHGTINRGGYRGYRRSAITHILSTRPLSGTPDRAHSYLLSS
jgi:hypothetical protein